MDKKACRTVALLSIHPKYAERLLIGSKGVELRKTKIYNNVEYIVIYSTSPVKKVVGYFSIARIVINSPSVIWSQYQEIAGIDQDDFYTYFERSSKAVAIEVAQIYPLTVPVPLSILGNKLKPPQSFQYLDYSAIEKLSEYSSTLTFA